MLFFLDRLAVRTSLTSPGDLKHTGSFVLSKSQRYDLFLNDPSIDTQNIREISFFEFGFPKYFWVYEYLPKHKQSCYNNGHNPFVVDPSIRELLKEVKEIKISSKKSKLGFKKTLIEENFNSQSELILFKEKYIFYDGVTQTPFRLSLTIEKTDAGYSIGSKIDSFYFYESKNLNFSFFDVFLTPITGKFDENNEWGYRSKKSLRFNVLTKETLITADGINNTGHDSSMWNYNQVWRREIHTDPKFKLIKNGFAISVNWSIYGNNLRRNNSLVLKKPTS